MQLCKIQGDLSQLSQLSKIQEDLTQLKRVDIRECTCIIG